MGEFILQYKLKFPDDVAATFLIFLSLKQLIRLNHVAIQIVHEEFDRFDGKPTTQVPRARQAKSAGNGRTPVKIWPGNTQASRALNLPAVLTSARHRGPAHVHVGTEDARFIEQRDGCEKTDLGGLRPLPQITEAPNPQSARVKLTWTAKTAAGDRRRTEL